MILFSFIALMNGAALALQQALNAALGVRVGSLGSSFINHLIGALVALLLLGIGLGMGHFHFAGISPFYFLGGCIGVCVVAVVNFAVPRVGVVLMSLLLMSFQLLASSVMDHFGWLGGEPIPVSIGRLGGIGLLITGSVLVFAKK